MNFIKKIILKVFLAWHICVLIDRLNSNNRFFIMSDRPWWVINSLSCLAGSNTNDEQFNDFVQFLISEAKKEIYLRNRQLSKV